MTRKKNNLLAIIVVSVLLVGNTFYANTTTFAVDEYLRIAQPVIKETLLTFDSQINIIGEARTGVDITVKVYENTTEEEIQKGSTIEEEPALYTIKTVGVTQTFNQLIDLKEGTNVVYIQYTYGTNAKVAGAVLFTIERKPEVAKNMMINYRVGQGEIEGAIKK